VHLDIPRPGGIPDPQAGIEEIGSGIPVMFAGMEHGNVIAGNRAHRSFQEPELPQVMKEIFGHIKSGIDCSCINRPEVPEVIHFPDFF
jgi:hypothetical protein